VPRGPCYTVRINVALSTGTILKDVYCLKSVIGKGGMGEVYAATDLRSGDDVAIKVMNRVVLGDTLIGRLRREAEAVRRVQSDYAPKLLDVDCTLDGEVFIAMERLYGESLSARMRVRGVLSWDEVRSFGQDILHGLIDAHTAGVIHRDLKPGNVFLTTGADGRERAKILDFGVCKIDAFDTEHLTETGEAIGTIAYMAPEQIRQASKVDERADLYSFGMIIFEMLTDHLAYDAQGQVALIAAKLERTARRVSELHQVPIPAGLETLLVKALAKNPKDRWKSAQELLRAWRALGPATVNPGVAVARDPASQATQTSLTAPTGMRDADGRQARTWLIASGAAAILALVVVSGITLLRFSRRDAAVAPVVAAPVRIATAVPVSSAVGASPSAAASSQTAPGEPPKAAGELDEPLVVSTVTVKTAPSAGAASAGARGPAASKGPSGSATAISASKPPALPHITKEPRY
jgi:hypothetical protein